MQILADTKDEEIVQQVINGNIDDFGEIMQRYEPRLMRYVVYLIHNEAMASDVVQDTFIKCYKNL